MRRNKGPAAIVALALAALTITATAGVGTSAGDPIAQTAGLKKCLKKAKTIEDKAKRKKAKKKCRKKFGAVAPVSVVRAKLEWFNGGSNDVDMDLFVFDASGNRAGNGADTIPQSSLSADVQGPAGSETFTDLNGNLHRPFGFGVCYTVGGSVHTDYTITYITSDGASHTDTRAGDNSLGSSGHVDYPADGVAIPSGYCPN
jgi:hypothetical protein